MGMIHDPWLSPWLLVHISSSVPLDGLGIGIAVLQSILKARVMLCRNEQMGSMIIVSTKDHKVEFRKLE